MRKIICVCLAIIVICISLTGCKHETKLTWKNINKYLNIKAEYTRVEKEDIYVYGTKMDGVEHYIQFKVTPKKKGYFEDVKFDVDIFMGDGSVYVWRVDPKGSAYNESQEAELKETIELSTDGKYTGRKHRVYKVGYHIKDVGLYDEPVHIGAKVSGTFTEE